MAKAKSLNGPNVPNKALHSRVSYLYQAANYLATLNQDSSVTRKSERQSEGRTNPSGHESQNFEDSSQKKIHHHGADTDKQDEQHAESHTTLASTMSRKLLSDLQTVSLKMQIRLSPAMKHTICKRCDTLLIDGCTCVMEVENKSKNGRKPWADVLVRKCTNCGCERRFPLAVERQPRRPQRAQKVVEMAEG
jgi:ribonuclease P protein subunit RPR2